MSAVDVALGRSSLTALVSSGAVTMKITSSTSTTSISGTMLISAIGAEDVLRSKLANAMTPSPYLTAASGTTPEIPVAALRPVPVCRAWPIDRKVSSSKAKASSLAVSTRFERVSQL